MKYKRLIIIGSAIVGALLLAMAIPIKTETNDLKVMSSHYDNETEKWKVETTENQFYTFSYNQIEIIPHSYNKKVVKQTKHISLYNITISTTAKLQIFINVY